MNNLRMLNNFVLIPIGVTVVLCFFLYNYSYAPSQSVSDENVPASTTEQDLSVNEVAEYETEKKPITNEPLSQPQETLPEIQPEMSENSDDYIDGMIGSVPYEFIVRDDFAERQQGLSGRTGLDENEGMLFVFPTDDYHSFWMKDMLFSIDIVWLDANQNVIYVESDISPDTFPQSFRPPVPARYVIELEAGSYKGQAISFDW